MKVFFHLKQAYIQFRTDYFEGHFSGKAGIMAVADVLTSISKRDGDHGLRPLQFQATGNSFVVKLNIRIEAEGQSKLRRIFEYMQSNQSRVGETFLKMVMRLKQFVEMGVYPIEAANLSHWYLEPKTNVVHFIAPQFLLTDWVQANSLGFSRLKGIRTSHEAFEEVYEQIIIAYMLFKSELSYPATMMSHN